MEQRSFTFQHRVTYSDCTAGNHVYYARYLDLFEAARGEFFRQTGVSVREWQDQGFIFPALECRLRYKLPARYDDLLAIQVWLTELGRLRLSFGYRATNQDGALALEAETFHVCTGLDEKPKRAPKELLQAFQNYLDASTSQAAGDRDG